MCQIFCRGVAYTYAYVYVSVCVITFQKCVRICKCVKLREREF